MKTHKLTIECIFKSKVKNKLTLKFRRRGDRYNFINEFKRLNELESVMVFSCGHTELLFNDSMTVFITKHTN